MKKWRNRFIIFVCLIAAVFCGVYTVYRLQQEKMETSSIYEDKSEELTAVQQEEVYPEPKEATILAAGDIMFHEPQIRAAYNEGNDTYDFKDTFKWVKPYISSSDLSIANLETVTAGKQYGYKGYPNFNSPEEVIEALKYAEFDVLSTANNHSLDQGKNGIISTIDNIEKYGLKNFGTYKTPNHSVLIENVNNINIALLSYTYGCNGMEQTLTSDELGYMINLIDEEKIRSDIEEAKKQKADLIVVFIHWGNEYQRNPNENQISLGEKMVKWGANIVFGSHPHVVQESQIIKKDGKNNFIIYSLGNFLSNQRLETVDNKYTEDGVMVQIQVEKNYERNETIIENITYIPTWVRKYKDGNKLKYEIIPVKEFLDNKEEQGLLTTKEYTRIEDSYKDTMDKMIK